MNYWNFLRSVVVGLWLFAFSVAMSGCASSSIYEDTSRSNFRERVSDLKVSGIAFYNGSYVGKEKDSCFPPSGKKICGEFNDSSLYKMTKKIHAKRIEFNISDRRSYLHEEVRELAHLVAAELTLQYGFKNFIIDKTVVSSACLDSYSANTRGTFSGDVYTSRTTVDTDTACSMGAVYGVFMFDDYGDVKAGVFSGNDKGINPAIGLYVDMDLIVRYPNHAREGAIKYYAYWPKEAWKTFYQASDIAMALRAKFKVPEFQKYIVTEPPPAPAPSILEQHKRTEN